MEDVRVFDASLILVINHHVPMRGRCLVTYRDVHVIGRGMVSRDRREYGVT